MIYLLDMNALTEGDSFSDIIKTTRDTIGLTSIFKNGYKNSQEEWDSSGAAEL